MLSNAANYPKSTTNTQILKPLLRNGIFVSQGELWSRQRKIMAPSTHAGMLAGYAKIIIKEAVSLRDQWLTYDPKTEIECGEVFTMLTGEIISRIMFGQSLGEHGKTLYEAFKEYQGSHGRMHLLELLQAPQWIPRPSMIRGRRAVKKFDQAILALLNKATPADDPETPPTLLQMLLAYRDDQGNPMPDDLIRDEMASIFLAGHETTAITLGWAFYLISSHPEVEHKLHQELDRVLSGRTPTLDDVQHLTYTRAIIDETLRLYPPVYVFSRQAIADDEVLGHEIPAGSFISIASWLLHRHELYWERPESFEPERFLPENSSKILPNTYIPFGLGPRVCMGKNLGILESVLIFAILAQRFKLRFQSKVPITPVARMTLRPDREMIVQLVPR
jgi:cytochrome P450